MQTEYRLHVSCTHLSTAGVSWGTLLPLLRASQSLSSLGSASGLLSDQSSLQHSRGPIPQPESPSPLSGFMETWGLTKFKVHREDNKEAHPTWPGRGLGAAAGQLRHSQLHQEALGAG